MELPFFSPGKLVQSTPSRDGPVASAQRPQPQLRGCLRYHRNPIAPDREPRVILELHAARQLDSRNRLPAATFFLEDVNSPAAWLAPFPPQFAAIALAKRQQVV